MSDEGNLLDFQARRHVPGDVDGLARLRRAPDATCPHPRFVIDAKQRTVACGTCGAWLDPVWCLLRFLEKDEAVERRIAYAKSLERDLEARRQRAIQRRQAAAQKAKREDAAKHCNACNGTGWAQTPKGVVRCGCRTGKGVALLL